MKRTTYGADTLTAAASNSIVLAPGSSSDDGAYEGWFIRLSSGPATVEYRRIAAYDGASRTASFSQPLPQVPKAGDGYDLTVPGPILGGAALLVGLGLLGAAFATVRIAAVDPLTALGENR